MLFYTIILELYKENYESIDIYLRKLAWKKYALHTDNSDEISFLGETACNIFSLIDVSRIIYLAKYINLIRKSFLRRA